MKILIADDKAENRILLRYIIQKLDHDIIEVTNGQEACSLFEGDSPCDIDLILMDIMMPIMDGIEATRKIKALNTQHHVAIIFVTALDNQETLNDCLKSGGDDFIPKPVNSVVLAAKLAAHQRIIEMHRELEENCKTLRYHQALIQAEHQVVNKIFHKAMKKNALNLPGFYYYLSPVSLFNGDLLLITEHPTEGIYFLIGDFTGHGLSAAIGSLPLTEIFFSLSESGYSISSIAEKMDSRLKEILPTSMFCCAALINLNPERTHIEAWVGGLDSLMITDNEGKLKLEVPSKHLPLGVHWGGDFNTKTEIYPIDHGDRIFAYTDGITEATNTEGNMFGSERLKSALVGKEPKQEIENIVNQVKLFCGEENQRDDMTIAQLVCLPQSNTLSGQQASLH